MKFFTAGYVLSQSEPDDPTNPVTIDSSESVQSALDKMFEKDYTQLPVTDNDVVIGAISYRSIARTLKTVQSVDVRQQTVGAAIEEPKFVDSDHDVYKLLETLAIEDYVLVGEPHSIDGILTRYDVLVFVRQVVEPFLLIGEIEESLRNLFQATYEDLEQKIEQSFAPRADDDESFYIPDSIQGFGYEHYITFIEKNWEEIEEQFSGEEEFIVDLLRSVKDTRNELFHFRGEAKNVDRDLLDIAHAQLTAPSRH